MSKLKDSYLTFIVKLNINGSTKQCLMTYRHLNKTISLLDVNTHKQIYSQSQISLVNKNIVVEQLVIGKNIYIQLNQNIKSEISIIAYADQYTKKKYLSKHQQLQSILFFIKPGFQQNKKLGEIFTIILSQFTIKRFKMFELTKQNLYKFIVNQKMLNTQNNQKNFTYLTSGPCFGFQLSGDNHLLIKMKKFVGSENPVQAKKFQPLSLRARYGSNIIENCCHFSKSSKSVQLQIDFIFSNQVKELKPKLSNSCLVLIKPHIIIDKKLGKLLSHLLQKRIQINSMRFQKLKPQLLKKYLDFYKFLPEYQQNLQHFQEDKSVFIEIKLNNCENPFQEFKTMCGPYDPQYAKKISPESLRAVFGIDRVRNAVHCTQLLQDTQSQIRLLFQL